MIKTIPLGQSELKISELAFGAWALGGWMWGGCEEKEAINALHAALDCGMTSIDTAPVYGFGRSEEIVGTALKGKRNKAQIMTKCGLRWDIHKGTLHFHTHDNEGKPMNVYKYSGKESVIHECEISLKRLNTDYIDLLQIHWPDTTTPIDETMEALELLIQQGKIRAAGVSNYNTEQMEQAKKKIPLASNQLPYSMLKREIETDIVPFCIEHNVGIIVYSPLQRGILSGKFKPGHTFNKGDSRAEIPLYSDNNIRIINSFLEEISPIAKKYQATLSQLVINWTLRQPGITSVLIGARNATQIEENAKTLNFSLSDQEINLINNSLKKIILE